MDAKTNKRRKGMGLMGTLLTLFIIVEACKSYFLVVVLGVFSHLDHNHNCDCPFQFNPCDRQSQKRPMVSFSLQNS